MSNGDTAHTTAYCSFDFFVAVVTTIDLDSEGQTPKPRIQEDMLGVGNGRLANPTCGTRGFVSISIQNITIKKTTAVKVPILAKERAPTSVLLRKDSTQGFLRSLWAWV